MSAGTSTNRSPCFLSQEQPCNKTSMLVSQTGAPLCLLFNPNDQIQVSFQEESRIHIILHRENNSRYCMTFFQERCVLHTNASVLASVCMWVQLWGSQGGKGRARREGRAAPQGLFLLQPPYLTLKSLALPAWAAIPHSPPLHTHCVLGKGSSARAGGWEKDAVQEHFRASGQYHGLPNSSPKHSSKEKGDKHVLSDWSPHLPSSGPTALPCPLKSSGHDPKARKQSCSARNPCSSAGSG